jgi:hypothetical protein
MNTAIARIGAVAVMLAFSASVAAFACVGAETCRMPCCRASSGDSSPEGGGGRPDCCGSKGAGITTCPAAARGVALPAEVRPLALPAAVCPAVAVEASAAPRQTCPSGRTERHTQQKIPIFILTRVLLI